jgi:CRP-like cAMP-binding protein
VNEEIHQELVAVAATGLILYGIGIPAWLFLELFKSRGHLHKKNHHMYHLTRFKLGSFFKTYEARWFYWEVVVIIEKMLLVGMLGIVEQYSPKQLMVGSTICIVYTLLVLRVAPYESDGDDWLAFLCTLSLTVTYAMGLLVALDEKKNPGFSDGAESSRVLNTEQVSVTLVVINSLPLVFFLWSVATLLRNKITNTNKVARPEIVSGLQKIQPVEVSAAVSTEQAVPRESRQVRDSALEHVVSAIHLEHDMHERALEKRNEKQKRASMARTKSRLAERARLKKSKKLHAVPCFASLNDDAIATMVDSMSYETHAQGEVICEQGAVADAFYVVCKGRCTASISVPQYESAGGRDGGDGGVSNSNELLKVGTIESGGHFGNQAFESDPESGKPPVRNATVTVDSESCDLLVLSRDQFFKLRGRGGVLSDDVIKMMQEVELARAKANEEMLGGRDRLQMGKQIQSAAANESAYVDSLQQITAVDKEDPVRAPPPPPPRLSTLKSAEVDTATLSPQETKMRAIFQSFDGDGNGRLSVTEFSNMMSQLGSTIDASTAREMILRDSKLEVSFEGFCDIVKAAGERTRRKEGKVGATTAQQVGTGSASAGRASLNAVVLEKYKDNHNHTVLS